ncbi:shikimate dehydrogenase family protein [Mesorhizobium xinjiangense]|uniref:shikimate dehydrogenase family protein n=1 Tax=Mesorhizobium xinjiangense TaxID=2678685 RepID=UPI001F215C75|nr:shikimate dehydrogenase [Mesorhizobium xinjiangense]
MMDRDRAAPGGIQHMPIRLGLIGDNIRRSRSPELHRSAGRLIGLDVTYDLFIPRDMSQPFDAVFERCRKEGLRGVNITYPYKEQAAEMVEIADSLIAAMGAVNTVVFGSGRAAGHNTDYSGFVAAYRQAFGDRTPGDVVMIGAGGVGRAVAFGLVTLGAGRLTIVDRDAGKAEALAAVVQQVSEGRMRATATTDAATAADAQGIINCTPVGMVGHPGSPVPIEALGGQSWAFDAVYTPVDTLFKQQAEAAGIAVLSGYELFFHQGVQAFRIFTGHLPPDLGVLRSALSTPPDHQNE